MRSAPPVAQDGDEPDVGQPLVDAPGDDPFALGGVCSAPVGGDRRARRVFGARRAQQPSSGAAKNVFAR
jgi:hypothetical protein